MAIPKQQFRVGDNVFLERYFGEYTSGKTYRHYSQGTIVKIAPLSGMVYVEVYPGCILRFASDGQEQGNVPVHTLDSMLYAERTAFLARTIPVEICNVPGFPFWVNGGLGKISISAGGQ